MKILDYLQKKMNFNNYKIINNKKHKGSYKFKLINKIVIFNHRKLLKIRIL